LEIVAHEVDYHGIEDELVAAYDITDRIRSQRLLRDSEAKYRVLFEDSSDAYWLLSSDGYVECNAAALRMFGFSERQSLLILPIVLRRINPMAGLLEAAERIKGAFLNGIESFEWTHRRKCGETFPAEVRLSALQLSGNQLLLATVRDITERRRSELASNLHNALLQAQSETTLDGILAVNENRRIIFANPQFASHFGIPRELIESRDDIAVRSFVAQTVDEPETFLQTIAAVYGDAKQRWADEIRLRNGKTLERYSAPLVEPGGCHRGRIWYFHEVTDRKAMETALREAEEKHRSIFENAGIEIFRATPAGQPVTVNRALARIHGFDSPEDLCESVSNAGTQLFVNPDDMQALVAAAAANETVEDAELEVFTKDKSRGWIRVNCHAVRDALGKLEYIDGTIDDITERKLAENRVESLTYFDVLTGLVNRSLLHTELHRRLQSHTEPEG
jgi:two-component system, sensor histidine kinase and response regulator